MRRLIPLAALLLTSCQSQPLLPLDVVREQGEFSLEDYDPCSEREDDCADPTAVYDSQGNIVGRMVGSIYDRTQE